MKITIAIDSFKGSLTSMDAGKAACEGIKKVYPDADINIYAVADGGEGTTEALVAGMGGRWRSIEVSDPLGRSIMASYGIIDQRKMAVVEMASAAGLTLLRTEERNPMKTTTFGVGQMIRDAVEQGCRSFLIGIGGSATNDGGAGMLQALGFELSDSKGAAIKPGAEGLACLHHISTESVIPELLECTFRIACDVENPLCGENGCSAVFGPQKGADEEMVHKMDIWLSHYAKLIEKLFRHADRNYPGAGAAGGLGFAFLSCTNAVLEPGIEIVLSEINLEDDIQTSDYVITGEGKLDGQTVMGKTPIGVARLAKRHEKPVIAFSGAVSRNASFCNAAGIDAFFPIVRGAVSLKMAMNEDNARKNMTDCAEQVFRLIRLAEK